MILKYKYWNRNLNRIMKTNLNKLSKNMKFN